MLFLFALTTDFGEAKPEREIGEAERDHLSGAVFPLAIPPIASPQNTFSMGDFEVSALLAGARAFDEPQGTFGMNVPAEEFEAVSEANFIPADRAQAYFTPTVVRTGSELVLFDTGLGPDSILAPLAAAGVAAEDVTIVVLTHMHGDHIGGLSGDGDDVVSGITAVAAYGHTPGHMGYRLESGDERLLVAADFANHYVWSLAYPDWEVRFDMDEAAAAATRKRVLDMLAAERMPFIGYHMPFPATGFVEARPDGEYRYVPTSYRMSL